MLAKKKQQEESSNITTKHTATVTLLQYKSK